ncbi:MAG: hypothetical protein WEA58_01125 [Balneolaceae bacterium]
MDTLILKTRNRRETKLLQELAQKMGIESKSLSEEEMEDLWVLRKISEADESKTVSRDEIMNLLDAE